jgi:hypothetical protein
MPTSFPCFEPGSGRRVRPNGLPTPTGLQAVKPVAVPGYFVMGKPAAFQALSPPSMCLAWV